MLRAASSSYFDQIPDEKLQDEFKNILTSATSFSPRRNEIAHGVVDYFLEEGLYKQNKTGFILGDNPQFALYPSWASFKERNILGVPSYCMSSVEINYFTGRFNTIVWHPTTLSRKIKAIWDAQGSWQHKFLSPDIR